MSDLPQGWAWTTLAEVGTWHGGGTPSKRNASFWERGTIPWLSPKDMGDSVLKGTQDRITEAAVVGSSTSLIPAGSVVLVVRSGILERTVPIALVPFETTLNQDMKAIVPHPGVDCRWLLYALQSRRAAILDQCRKDGTTVASLDMGKLQALPISLPPVAEQRRIVEALEDHLSRLDAAQFTLKEANIRLLRLQALGFEQAALGRDVLEPTVVGDLCEVYVGSTPSRSNPELWSGELPWVSSGEVAFNRIAQTREKISRSAAGNPETRIHPPGTVMIAMIGEGKTRGQVAILDIEAAHNQNCASIRIDRSKLIPEFVYHSLRSRYEQNRSANAAGGVQPALNKSKVQQLPLPLFSLEDQREIVDEVESADYLSGRLAKALAEAQNRSVALRQSLLRAAFNGELVDQDPSDEPAQVALDRVHNETPSSPKRTGRRPATATIKA